MFANLTGFHLLIIVGVVVLLFGAAKLPLLAKNLGQSAKILKREIGSLHEDEPAAVPARTEATPARAADAPAAPAAETAPSARR
jgi:sec-independent protein translocase protein TatA